MTDRVIRTKDLALPVFTASREGAGVFVVHQIVGTCFAVTTDVLMTAWHVIAALNEAGSAGVVGFVSLEGGNKGAEIVETERLGADVGLLKVKHTSAAGTESLVVPMYWRSAPLEQFDPVRSLGYPYGIYEIDGSAKTLLRGFQGHVVSNIPLFRPIGMAGPTFPVFEVSFAAPRGLSGAALLLGAGNAAVCGLVIGNSSSKMLVFESEDVEEGSGGRTVYQHYEALSHGVAIQGEYLLAQHSNLLGATIGECVARHQRLLAI